MNRWDVNSIELQLPGQSIIGNVNLEATKRGAGKVDHKDMIVMEATLES